ncbi:MAG: hypothetical protein ACREQY_10840 [Candidatus Binatia bacterium]
MSADVYHSVKEEWNTPTTTTKPMPSVAGPGSWLRLPPAQAVVSVVGDLGIENPETAPMASGGASPLAIVVGRQSVSVAWDHRVYDAVGAAKLYEELFP